MKNLHDHLSCAIFSSLHANAIFNCFSFHLFFFFLVISLFTFVHFLQLLLFKLLFICILNNLFSIRLNVSIYLSIYLFFHE